MRAARSPDAGPDAGIALIRALRARTPSLAVEGATSTRWASMTFTGARHHLRARLPTADYAAFSEGLDTAEFKLPGHILADIAIEHSDRTDDSVLVEIGALTLEDC